MRKERGIKVAAICEYMGGLSEQAIYKWERGACLPTIDNLLALSHLYRVPMEELLVFEEAETASYFLPKMGQKGQVPMTQNGSEGPGPSGTLDLPGLNR